MPNVDLCVRYAEAGLCGDFEENALKISRIPDDLRNIVFRQKTAPEISDMLRGFSAKIKTTVSERFGFSCIELFPSSNNNKDGADLFCLSPDNEKIIIEVKFGAYTDKAAGMDAFAKIFNTTIFSEALSLERRHEMRELVKSEYPDLSFQSQRLAVVLNSTIKSFNELLNKDNHRLAPESQLFLEEYLLNNSGSYTSEETTKGYIRFEVNRLGDDINEAALVQKGLGIWRVDDVALIASSDEEVRATVYVYNDTTHLRIKFTLNNKNNFRLGDIEIRSKYMLGCPSWNVWLKKV